MIFVTLKNPVMLYHNGIFGAYREIFANVRVVHCVLG